MIRTEQHGDVTALRFSWHRSRVVGYEVSAFVVRDVLIDTGFPGAATAFRAWLRDARPRGVFITHHHEDHAGNLDAVAEQGIPVAAHAFTRQYAAKPQRIPFYRRFTWQAARPVATAVEAFSDDALHLLPTPGHSVDHHAVWDSETGTLFAGDLYLGAKVRIAQAGEDPRALAHSLRAMIARAPSRVFCSHRGLLRHGANQLAQKADWMDELVGAVDRRIAAGWDDRAIRRELLGRLPMTHWFSQGEYSPDNIVRALRVTFPTR